MLPYVVGMAWVRTTAWIILGVMVFGLIILFLVLRSTKNVLMVLDRLEQNKSVLIKFMVKFGRSLLLGFESLKNPKQFLIGFGFVLSSWLVSFVQFSVLTCTLSRTDP